MASEAKRAKLDSSQILYEKLKCQICESRVKAGKHHWYRCTQGHRICQDCREVKETKKCSCTKFIPFQHCEVIEALLNEGKMEFKCENLTRGCNESLDEDNMIFHQTECIYRLVDCPQRICKSKVPFHELLDHMKPDCIVDLSGVYNTFVFNYDRKISVGHYRPRKIIAENKVFFSVIRFKEDLLYHWIQFYGSSIEAKKYSYTLEYHNTTKTPEITCSFGDQVVSIDETADSIIEKVNCMAISRKLFENKFVLTDDTFKFSVKIRNLKEEIKDENVESVKQYCFMSPESLM